MTEQPEVAAVLVVEDEPLIALDIEDMLAGCGVAVRLARNLAEARAFLAVPPPPRLVLLDVVLPDGRSFDLACDILAAGLPLVFLTGYEHGIPDALRQVEVIEKPFNADALVAVVRRSAPRAG